MPCVYPTSVLATLYAKSTRSKRDCPSPPLVLNTTELGNVRLRSRAISPLSLVNLRRFARNVRLLIPGPSKQRLCVRKDRHTCLGSLGSRPGRVAACLSHIVCVQCETWLQPSLCFFGQMFASCVDVAELVPNHASNLVGDTFFNTTAEFSMLQQCNGRSLRHFVPLNQSLCLHFSSLLYVRFMRGA